MSVCTTSDRSLVLMSASPNIALYRVQLRPSTTGSNYISHCKYTKVKMPATVPMFSRSKRLMVITLSPDVILYWKQSLEFLLNCPAM